MVSIRSSSRRRTPEFYKSHRGLLAYAHFSTIRNFLPPVPLTCALYCSENADPGWFHLSRSRFFSSRSPVPRGRSGRAALQPDAGNSPAHPGTHARYTDGARRGSRHAVRQLRKHPRNRGGFRSRSVRDDASFVTGFNIFRRYFATWTLRISFQGAFLKKKQGDASFL